MVLIEKPAGFHFPTTGAVVALDLQPHPVDIVHSSANKPIQRGDENSHDNAQYLSGWNWDTLDRLAAGAGSFVKIWTVQLNPEVHSVHSISPELRQSTGLRSTNLSSGIVIKKEEDNEAFEKFSGCALQNQWSVGSGKELPPSSKAFEVDCHIVAHCVFTLKEHAPQYVVGVRWSPTGLYLASCDNRTIIVSKFYKFVEPEKKDGAEGAPDEVWTRAAKMTEPQSDLFDLCWFGDEQVLTGTVDGIKVWDVSAQRAQKMIPYPKGFVTGLGAHARRFVAAESNDKRLIVWGPPDASSLQQLPLSHAQQHFGGDNQSRFRTPGSVHAIALAGSSSTSAVESSTLEKCNDFLGLPELFQDREILRLGPAEIPYYRRPSFDPAGKMVAFPYGEKGSQCFGVMYPLTGIQKPASLTLDTPMRPLPGAHSTDDAACDDLQPFRFRGHHSRVNAVAFSKGVWRRTVKKTSSVETTSKGGGTGETAASAKSASQVSGSIIHETFTLYAQASVDGALSVWKVAYPNGGAQSSNPQATCILVLKPRFLDEQASVTDMTWSSTGNLLAVSSDDGSITFVHLSDAELRATKFLNKRFWSRLVGVTLHPPRPPPRLQKNILPSLLLSNVGASGSHSQAAPDTLTAFPRSSSSTTIHSLTARSGKSHMELTPTVKEGGAIVRLGSSTTDEKLQEIKSENHTRCAGNPSARALSATHHTNGPNENDVVVVILGSSPPASPAASRHPEGVAVLI